MNTAYTGFPAQQLSFKAKNKSWRKKNVDWGTDRATVTYSPVRKTTIHKKINYDLLHGILHMNDLQVILNPADQDANFIPERIQHYPIMNSKLNILIGEESKRPFNFRVVVTNPTAVSEVEENKKNALFADLQQIIQESSQSEEEFNQKLEELNDFYTYTWQDVKELNGNYLLNHYMKEYNIPSIFTSGFYDVTANSEEIYQCDIISGEPTLKKLDPLKVRVFRSGYSTKIEDADMIVIEDYWSPGAIIDTFYRELSPKDIKHIEEMPNVDSAAVDSMDNIDERKGFINTHMLTDQFEDGVYFDPFNLFSTDVNDSLLPYDMAGNIRVCQVYWKSRRKIKEVKSYDPITGEEIFQFYPETYVLNETLGEEEQIYWINEAWEGTKIGDNIYVNMRPRVVQYNRLSNPSRCHFGIVGSIYSFANTKPFSLVDMMKPYNYLYDVIHDRLNKLIAKNWGKIVTLDLAKVPTGWNIDKWLYYAKTNNLAVVDSFKEGNVGAATGKLAGGLNNASSGVIDADFGNNIQQYINLLEFIKLEMSEVIGISKQREGQISNRETVGGVERATLQSSHITEWLFTIHEDVKKRVLECFLETAKVALKGRNKKFYYILPDGTRKLVEIDGDYFAESDYGLVVDNSQDTQEFNQKLDMLAQAALQNQTLSFSTIAKLYSSCSLAEKERLIEKDEKAIQERAAQAQQAQIQAQQEQVQAQLQQKQAEIQAKDQMNQRDNETKILIATIQAETSSDGIEEPIYSQEAKDQLAEKIREFDAKLALDKEKLNVDKSQFESELKLKEKQLNKKPSTTK